MQPRDQGSIHKKKFYASTRLCFVSHQLVSISPGPAIVHKGHRSSDIGHVPQIDQCARNFLHKETMHRGTTTESREKNDNQPVPWKGLSNGTEKSNSTLTEGSIEFQFQYGEGDGQSRRLCGVVSSYPLTMRDAVVM